MDSAEVTGAQMFERTIPVREMVLDALTNYPSCRGNDMLLYIHILRKNYWRVVRIDMKCGLTMKFQEFKDIMRVPSFETCRRRRQEIQEIEKHRISRGEILYSNLLPKEKTVKKRKKLENAYRHMMCDKQLNIMDYLK